MKFKGLLRLKFIRLLYSRYNCNIGDGKLEFSRDKAATVDINSLPSYELDASKNGSREALCFDFVPAFPPLWHEFPREIQTLEMP